VLNIIVRPSPAAARATANSASGWTMERTADGCQHDWRRHFGSQHVVRKVARGHIAQHAGHDAPFRKASLLARMVSSAPAPPAT